MAEAASIGVLPDQLLHMTPREVRALFAGAKKRRTRDTQLAMFTAWHAGAFSRYNPKKKLPPLGPMLDRMGERREMNDRELRTALLGWHKAVGGSTRVVPREVFHGSR